MLRMPKEDNVKLKIVTSMPFVVDCALHTAEAKSAVPTDAPRPPRAEASVKFMAEAVDAKTKAVIVLLEKQAFVSNMVVETCVDSPIARKQPIGVGFVSVTVVGDGAKWQPVTRAPNPVVFVLPTAEEKDVRLQGAVRVHAKADIVWFMRLARKPACSYF